MGKKAALKKSAPIIDVPIEVAQVSAQPKEPVDWWTEDPRREQALEMILDGMSKSAVAKALPCHRNTVNNWCADARFVAEANARMNEHKAGKRIRRLRTTNLINDKVEKVSLALIGKIESAIIDPKTGKAVSDIPESINKTMSLFRQMAYEFREIRGQERIDYGDDVKKVAINSTQTITGDVHVTQHGVNDTPFADYVRKSLANRSIDVEAIEVKGDATGGQLLLRAAEHLMVDTDLLDEINEEDKLAEEASRG